MDGIWVRWACRAAANRRLVKETIEHESIQQPFKSICAVFANSSLVHVDRTPQPPQANRPANRDNKETQIAEWYPIENREQRANPLQPTPKTTLKGTDKTVQAVQSQLASTASANKFPYAPTKTRLPYHRKVLERPVNRSSQENKSESKENPQSPKAITHNTNSL